MTTRLAVDRAHHPTRDRRAAAQLQLVRRCPRGAAPSIDRGGDVHAAGNMIFGANTYAVER
jgi:hypothetical protein